MFHLALLPEHRTETGVTVNPFVGIARDRPRRRTLALNRDQVRALITHAAPHLGLAIAIGALAPKLRLGNILALQWRTHLDANLQWITVQSRTTRPTSAPGAPWSCRSSSGCASSCWTSGPSGRAPRKSSPTAAHR